MTGLLLVYSLVSPLSKLSDLPPPCTPPTAHTFSSVDFTLLALLIILNCTLIDRHCNSALLVMLNCIPPVSDGNNLATIALLLGGNPDEY